ncbi:unnamed protein product [Rhodiola kirilowii]
MEEVHGGSEGEDAYVALRVATCLTVLALIIFAAS